MSLLATEVSFGKNIRQPESLQTRIVGDVLVGIHGGAWRSEVEQVRALPPDARRDAKLNLPFIVPSGTFSRRDSNHLLKHSGLVGIDMDGLDGDPTRGAMHVAVDDEHCFAAFRSASGEGVRLLIRVPPVSAPQHGFVFDAAATHVRSRYGITPDLSGRDVARASFVTYDSRIWINKEAIILPVLLPEIRRKANASIAFPKSDMIPGWHWLALEYQPHSEKPDGTAFTHLPLLDLGKRLAKWIHCERGWSVADEIVIAAAREWFEESQRRGLRLRGSLVDYTAELKASVFGARKRSWFVCAVEMWTRWNRDPDCPKSDSKAALLFAIRRHCNQTGQRDFFLSCRDAATVTGTSHVRAAQILNQLCREGRLVRLKGTRPARHACSFKLLAL